MAGSRARLQLGESLWEVCSHRRKQSILSVLSGVLPGQLGLVCLRQYREGLLQQLEDVAAATGQGPA